MCEHEKMRPQYFFVAFFYANSFIRSILFLAYLLQCSAHAHNAYHHNRVLEHVQCASYDVLFHRIYFSYLALTREHNGQISKMEIYKKKNINTAQSHIYLLCGAKRMAFTAYTYFRMSHA